MTETRRALLEAALEHHQAGRLADAERLYRKVLEAEPANAEALHLLGLARSQAGRPEDAIRLISGAIEAAPRNTLFLGNLGHVYRSVGRLTEAVSCFRAALAIEPTSLALHISLGNALKEKGSLDQAIESYRRALALEPKHAEALNLLGNALKASGRLAEAVACYRRALAVDAYLAEVHGNLGLALAEQGRLDAAVACLERALALNPDLAEVHNGLGNALADQGSLDLAARSYGRAIGLRPDYAEALCNLGGVLRAQGKLEDACALAKRAIRLSLDAAMADWAAAGARTAPIERRKSDLKGELSLSERGGDARPGLDAPLAREALLRAKAALDRLGVPFFLTFGTLLGCVREGDFIAGDSDVDIGVWEDAPRAAIVAEFERNGFRRLPGQAAIERPLEREINLAFLYKERVDFDVFVHMADGDDVWCAIEMEGGTWLKWRNARFGLRPVSFLGSEFFAPDDSERYLRESYGDWRTPEPGFMATLDARNIVPGNEETRDYLAYSAYFHAWKSLDARDYPRARKRLAYLVARHPDDAELRHMLATLESRGETTT